MVGSSRKVSMSKTSCGSSKPRCLRREYKPFCGDRKSGIPKLVEICPHISTSSASYQVDTYTCACDDQYVFAPLDRLANIVNCIDVLEFASLLHLSLHCFLEKKV